MMPNDVLTPEFQNFVALNEDETREKFVNGKWVPYKDSAGKWTVGYGHLIGDGTQGPGRFAGGLSDEEAKRIFHQDLVAAKDQAAAWVGDDFESLPPHMRQMATDLTFNLGPNRVRKFKNFRQALLDRDMSKALAESKRFAKNEKTGKMEPIRRRNERFKQFFSPTQPANIPLPEKP